MCRCVCVCSACDSFARLFFRTSLFRTSFLLTNASGILSHSHDSLAQRTRTIHSHNLQRRLHDCPLSSHALKQARSLTVSHAAHRIASSPLSRSAVATMLSASGTQRAHPNRHALSSRTVPMGREAPAPFARASEIALALPQVQGSTHLQRSLLRSVTLRSARVPLHITQRNACVR